MTEPFFNTYRCPFSPPASNRLPMEAAWPIQKVWTGDWIYCIVSYIASPAVTDPPGELMYNLIGSVGFSASRNKSWAVRSVDGMSDTCHQL